MNHASTNCYNINMKYLGIDYGESKVGFAIGNDAMAMPLDVFYYKQFDQLLKKINEIISEENTQILVVGLSENTTADKTRDFIDELKQHIDLEIIFQDETLSTKDAQALAIDAGIQRKRRKNMEDAFAATLILQSYLDNN